MKALLKPPAVAPTIANVLSVSPVEEDHSALERIFNEAPWAAPSETLWQLFRTRTLACAQTALRQVEYAVVMCERDLGPGGWKDLLESTHRSANSPLLIVTSRLADEYLWAEALNLGAYDVLAKPFYPAEVIRVVNLACLRWQREGRQVGPSMVADNARGQSGEQLGPRP